MHDLSIHMHKKRTDYRGHIGNLSFVSEDRQVTIPEPFAGNLASAATKKTPFEVWGPTSSPTHEKQRPVTSRPGNSPTAARTCPIHKH